MTNYKFEVEGRRIRGNLMSVGYSISGSATQVYVAENAEQVRILAQRDNFSFGIGGKITRLGRTKEPLDSRVKDIKLVERLRAACLG
jgi:hypothetical protein